MVVYMIRSMKEFDEKYFPKATREKKLFELQENPKEFGRFMAKELLEKIKRGEDVKSLCSRCL